MAQKAIRKVACNVFEHLLRLDLNFHLSRQTGGLTRAIDRGTKGISFLLTSMVFHILPTALEISMVCGILVRIVYFRHIYNTDCLRHTSMDPSLRPLQLRQCLDILRLQSSLHHGAPNSESKPTLQIIKAQQWQLIH